MEKFDILELLPQRPPFVMVDRLRHCDPVITETELEVREDNMFCRDGILFEPGVVENIAQTCAARMGYINKINNEKVKIGFIGALRNLSIHDLPKVNEMLLTRIEVQSEVMALTLVKATVECCGRLIAECEMKIAISEN